MGGDEVVFKGEELVANYTDEGAGARRVAWWDERKRWGGVARGLTGEGRGVDGPAPGRRGVLIICLDDPGMP